MVYMYIYVVFSALLCFFLILVNILLGGFYMLNSDKDSSFECGFIFYGLTRLSFSMRYFLLTVIFVVFDVEVVLLFPGVYVMGLSVYFGVWVVFGYFLLILFLGVMYELREGAMSWSY